MRGAIYKRDDGLVILDPAKCTGCRNCLDACPYDAIYFNEDLNIAQKCTGCAHLLDTGWKEPRCVDACPRPALKLMEESEARELVQGAEILRPEYNAKPRVYYLNVPKKFVGGTVYDPVKKDVIAGAACTLTDRVGHEKLQTVTDGFGDFWFEGLKVGNYSLSIEKGGYSRMEIKSIDTEKDVNLGDLALTLQQTLR